MLCDACAIRVAIEIDALVSEQLPYAIEIAHRDARGVHAQISLLRKLIAALDIRRPDFDFIDAFEKVLVPIVAVEPVRPPRAALVYEDDVAVAAHAIERARRRRVKVDG